LVEWLPVGRFCLCHQVEGYSVSLFWKLRASLEEKRAKRSKRKNKKLQPLIRGLEDSRVDVVSECVLFGILVKSRVSFFCKTLTIATLFFIPNVPALLYNASSDEHFSWQVL